MHTQSKQTRPPFPCTTHALSRSGGGTWATRPDIGHRWGVHVHLAAVWDLRGLDPSQLGAGWVSGTTIYAL